MRVVKEHDERRNEILDAATELFQTKGYVKCTINDILEKVKIAKGTFYYYFKSKDEVLDAVVLRFCDVIESRAKQIASSQELEPQDKLIQVFLSMKIDDQVGDELLDQVHNTENAVLQQKIMNRTIKVLAPILAKVIEGGNKMGVWNCKYPLPYMQIFLASSISLMDGGIFELPEDEQETVFIALMTTLEKMLNVPENSIVQMMMQNFTEQGKKTEQ